MPIGKGWSENIFCEENEIHDLSVVLLKDKLDYVFKDIKENPNIEKIAPKGRYYG